MPMWGVGLKAWLVRIIYWHLDQTILRGAARAWRAMALLSVFNVDGVARSAFVPALGRCTCLL